MSIPRKNQAEVDRLAQGIRGAKYAIYYGNNIFVAALRGDRSFAEKFVELRIADQRSARPELYHIVDLYEQPKPKRFSVEVEGVDKDDAERKLRDALRAGPTTLELREVI